MIVDAHHHYWNPARGDYGWLERTSPLHRCCMPYDLRPLMAEAGVEASILVQAAPTMAETDWLLDLARRETGVLGVVGWLDLNAPDIPEQLRKRRRRGLVGIRPMLQDIADQDWILAPQRGTALAALAAEGLVFDALVRPEGLEVVARLADRHPGLSIVLDHAGKPPIGRPGAMREWDRTLQGLSRHRNVSCKLSGLLTEAPAQGRTAAVSDTIHRLLDIWGPDRLLWGSDWPVLTLAGDYAGWLTLARDAMSGLSGTERSAVFGANARRIYGV